MKPKLMYRIARFYSMEFLVYPLETLMLIFRRVFIVGLLILFWYLVGRDNDIQNVQILPYILIASGVQFITVGQNFRLGNDYAVAIKTGQLNNVLIRPIDELRYELSAYLGRNVFEFVFSIINIAVGLILLDAIDLSRLALFLLSMPPAFAIGYYFNVLTGAMAFWLVETSFIRMMTYFIFRIISGLFIPLTFFGDIWGTVLAFLPFAQTAFTQGFIISGDDYSRGVMLVVADYVWAVLMAVMTRRIWLRGLRRYGAVGI